MPAPDRQLPKHLLRLAGAGIGTLAAGPLGAALGASFGSLAGELLGSVAEKYLEKGGDKLGEKLSEFGVHYCFENFRELQQRHPPLAAVVQEALRESLGEICHQLNADQRADYANWFRHWDLRLKSPNAVAAQALRGFTEKLHSGTLVSQKETDIALDQLFRQTMERLDAEGAQQAAANDGGFSVVAVGNFRTLPDDLLSALLIHLPPQIEPRLRELLTLPENRSAWITIQQSFQADARRALLEIAADVKVIKEQTNKLLAFQEQQLQQAVDEKRIAQDQVRAERADKDEWIRKYTKLLEEVAERKKEPAESSFETFLKTGDLTGAVRAKEAQIQKRQDEVKKLAQDWAELGRVHELRFAWAEAMQAFREAVRIDENQPEYLFKFAYFAQKQNRFGDAIEAYRKLLSLYTDPAQLARALNNLAILYGATQRMKEAETGYGEALEIRRRLAEANPEAYLPDVARTLNNLAVLYSDTQRMKEAETAYGEALEKYRRLAEANPEAYLPDVARTLNNLALLYSDTQRMKEAETAHMEALEIRRRLAEANPEAYLPYVAMTLNNLAILYSATQRMQEARECCGEAQAICEPLWRAQPELHGDQMARIFGVQAMLLNEEHKPAACEYARRALEAAFAPGLKEQAQELISQYCN